MSLWKLALLTLLSLLSLSFLPAPAPSFAAFEESFALSPQKDHSSSPQQFFNSGSVASDLALTRDAEKVLLVFAAILRLLLFFPRQNLPQAYSVEYPPKLQFLFAAFPKGP